MSYNTSFSKGDAAFATEFSPLSQTFDTAIDSSSVVIQTGDAYIKVEQTADGVLITAVDVSGTSQAVLLNGKNGKDGTDGKDGYTPVKGKDYFDGKDGINGKDGIDGKDGTNGKDGLDGKTPEKGVDYFTDADKAEVVSAVIAALPVYGGEVESA